jgi:hypothetical protein
LVAKIIIIIIITCLEIVFQARPSMSELILIKRHKQSVQRWTITINSIEKIIIIKPWGGNSYRGVKKSINLLNWKKIWKIK